MQQHSDGWFQARLGKATASNYRKIMATIKNGEAADRRNYRAQLIVERLTGKVIDSYTNGAMQWGTDTEPFARIAYIATLGIDVEEIGFVAHGTLQAGCSPDGLIGADGLVEIKCPNSATHIDTLKLQAMPSEHKAQVQGQLWITNRQWADFVSYDPRMPEKLQLVIARVERDDAYIEILAAEVAKFLAEVDAEIVTLSKIAA